MVPLKDSVVEEAVEKSSASSKFSKIREPSGTIHVNSGNKPGVHEGPHENENQDDTLKSKDFFQEESLTHKADVEFQEEEEAYMRDLRRMDETICY